MTWRVRIDQDVRVDGVAIQLARGVGDGGHVELLRFTSVSEVVGRSEASASMPAPSLVIDDDLGRALLDALAAHYGGTSAGQQMRADYEHERRRVDQMLDHLMREGGAA